MSPSVELGHVLVDELVRSGVTDVVLCPGSRNAPLSFALYEADAAGRLRLHVRIDERGAAFLALGLAMRGGGPVAVACTSGTAVANLHPAVLEASYAGVPLLALTADRPAELVGTGANQTIEQVGIFGSAARQTVVLSSSTTGDRNARWRSGVSRAVAASRGLLGIAPGPVQINLAFGPPLVPDGSADAVPAGRPGGQPWTTVTPTAAKAVALQVDLSLRTLVIAGHGAGSAPAGVPVIAEPTAACWPGSLAAGPWILGALPSELRPEQVLVLGRPTLHRGVTSLLADSDLQILSLTTGSGWADVSGSVRAVGGSVEIVGGPTDPMWMEAWSAADKTAAEAVAGVLDDEAAVTGLHVARQVVAAAPEGAAMVLGSSNPVRDVALAARPRAGLKVFGNRGVAGIDGTVSTAIGVALAHRGPTVALLGDLTFLHDSTGLVLGPAEHRPDLTIVVANDDGGGIFGLLEQGAPEHGAAFERIFGTPHGTDLSAICAAHGIAWQRVESGDFELPVGGLRVVEVATQRRVLRDLHARIAAAVGAA